MVHISIKIISIIILLSTFAAGQDNSTANCTNPLFTVDAFKARNQTRPRYLATPAVSELKYCKVFSNKTSCCNTQTDSDIENIFRNYKEVLGNLTSKKLRGIKKGFEDYSNIDFSNLTAGDKAKEKVSQVVQSIKARLNQTTKGAVACAKQALKLTAGLLCSGCNSNWGKFIRNNSRFVLSKNSCLALSNACYGLLKDFDSLQNNSKADVSNLTDAITEFVGEDIPLGQNDLTSDIPSGARILLAAQTNANKNFDRDAYCKKWTDAKVDDSCKVCYFDLPSFYDYTKPDSDIDRRLKEISPLCASNPIILAAREFVKTAWPNNDKGQTNFDAQDIIREFWESENVAVLPAVIKSSDIIIPFLSGNETVNNNLIAFIKSKAANQLKNQKISDLIEKIKISIARRVELNLVKNKLDFQFPLLTEEEFIQIWDKIHLICALKAENFVRAEQKIKSEDKGYLQVELQGQRAGAGDLIINSVAKVIKSKLFEFFKNCTSNTLNSKASMFQFYFREGFNVLCFQEDCILANPRIAQRTPPAQNQAQLASSYDNLKNTKVDPQRVSKNTGRKIPEQLDLPQDVNKVIEAIYKAPCDNVTDCARWFCTKFLNGPFARVEKVLNPQNQSDSLDGDATNAYNTELPKRLLQAEVENELSDDGFNFIAVADNSGFESSLVIDGVSEAASSYDSSITVNNTLDPNAFIPSNSSNSSAKVNETSKGNYLIGKIGNSFIFLIFIVLFALL